MSEIVLRTATTSYVLTPTPTGLCAVSWGPEATPPIPLPDHAEFDITEDLLPQEFAVEGTRQVLESELMLHTANQRGAAVRLESYDVSDDRVTAVLTSGDPGLRIDHAWDASREHDVIRRTAKVRNTGDETVMLDQALTGAFNVHLPHGAAIDALAGSWCQEFTPLQAQIPRGIYRLESRQGLNSHLYSPVMVLADPDDATRGCWAVALAWPGSFELNAHVTSRNGWVRVAGGLHGEEPVALAPGEELELPELHGLWAPNRDEAARRWHTFQATLLRSTSSEHRAVTYNSWYATEFDVTVDQQLRLAEQAAAMGAEMFVVDDGWFLRRNSDAAGLGDWRPDPEHFPAGLAPLAGRVKELGMRFGLWVEPECVNPESDLFRAHPDWIHRSPDREPATIRNQYVLNLGLPQVEQFVRDTLDDVIRTHGVDHLKWDMNRAITDTGPIPSAPKLAHAQALLRVLRWLRETHPEVTLEICSGGGARVSNAVLPWCDVVWPSDETGPRDRLEIQHGFLSAFPAAAMSSWVTHLDGVRDSTPASYEYRFCVAMCGVLSVGADLRQWSDADHALAAKMIALYKDIRHLVLDGAMQRHGNPREHGYAVEYAGESETVLFVFGRPDSDEPVKIMPSVNREGEPLCIFGQARWQDGELVVDVDPNIGAVIVRLGVTTPA